VGRAISEVLPFAVGVAISPVPIIAVILVLFSARARANGPAFLAGWVAGLAVVCTVVYSIADAGDVSTDAGASDATSWVKLALGLVLLLAAARRWRHRPAPGANEPMPRWMAAIDGFTPGRAFAIGAMLSAVNPKNLVLTIGAAANVAQAGVSATDAAVALGVFVVLASLGIAVPVLLSLSGGERVAHVLDGWKAWLSAHNAAVMAVLLLVFGVVLVSQGLRGLTA
jgi:hypothetical protein